MRRFAVATWLFVASGCTYITSAELEAKRDGLDEDHDGSPRSEDCDDKDGSRSPKFPEIPYDGIDNDCGNDGDVVDADGDGYPGITADAYGELQVENREPYPPELVGKPLDCADDPVAHPEAADVFPGNPAEVPYDGVDSNCDRSNDFDADGDGYMPASVVVDGAPVDVASAFDRYVQTWGLEDQLPTWAPGGQNAPQIGDCDDFEPRAHPNPDEVDEPYDGIDLDCDGSNDFDADGDGFMPATVPLGDAKVLYAEYVARYFQNDPPWTLPSAVTLPDGTQLDAFSDCLDQPNPAIVPIGGADPADPATVYPQAEQAVDAWYDGIDTNCWGDDDFDQDLDVFYPDTLPGGQDGVQAYHDYVANWGYESREALWAAAAGLEAPGPGDCNDTDPSAYPAALEYVGDGKDQDCDGSNDASRFTFADFQWTNPSAPRIIRLGSNYVWALNAGEAVFPPNAPLEEVGVALSVGLGSAVGGAVPVVSQFKLADANQPMGPVVALAAVPNAVDYTSDGVPDPAAWVTTTVSVQSNGQTYLRGYRLYEHSAYKRIDILGPTVSNYTDSFSPGSIDVTVDSAGEPYLLACTSDLLYAIQSVSIQPSEPSLLDPTAGVGDRCVFNTSPYSLSGDEVAEFTRCSGSKCQDFQLVRSSSSLVVTPGGLTGELWNSVASHGPVQILLGSSSTVLRNTLDGSDTLAFQGEQVVAADGMLRESNGTLFAAAIVDDPTDGTVVNLQYQNNAGGAFDELRLPFTDPALPDVVPYGVAVQVDDDRVVVVVTAHDPLGTPGQDAVGWMFLGTP